MTTTEPMTQQSSDSQGIGGRVRSLPVAIVAFQQRARSQWLAIPEQVRAAFDQLLERVRTGLDLPSRGEVSDLVTRIDELDRKLAAMQAARAAAAAAPKPAAKPKAKAKTRSVKTKPGPTAGKAARRSAIAEAAKNKS
jgi:hypothetical protein